MKKKITAFLLSGIVSLSAVFCTASPVFSADSGTGTVTVTVYDGETGALFDNSAVQITVDGVDTTSTSMFTPHYIYGIWRPAEINPYTVEDVPLDPNYAYSIGIFNDSALYDAEPYYYVIDEERSDTAVTFENGVSKPKDVYLIRKYDAGAVGGFWVYRGTNETAQAPVFEQYYPGEDGKYVHRRICYQGTLGTALSYGDMLTTEDIVNTKNGVLTQDTAWTDAGSCCDLPDIRTLTVMSENPYSVTSSAETHRLLLSDDSGSIFIFSMNYDDLQTDVTLDDARRGDTISFAFYENTPILPLAPPEHHHPAGDVNGDYLFRADDAALLGKWLLADPDAMPADWRAGDYNEDGILNALDFSLMKRALLVQDQLPHCTLTVTTTGVKTSITGETLDDTRTTEESYTVFEGDSFSENSGSLICNAPAHSTTAGMLFQIETITPESVSFCYYSEMGWMEHAASAYNEKCEITSRVKVYNGYNNTYTLVFSTE